MLEMRMDLIREVVEIWRLDRIRKCIKQIKLPVIWVISYEPSTPAMNCEVFGFELDPSPSFRGWAIILGMGIYRTSADSHKGCSLSSEGERATHVTNPLEYCSNHIARTSSARIQHANSSRILNCRLYTICRILDKVYCVHAGKFVPTE